MGKGRLIAFEGIDKAGKGTQSRIMAERLGATRIAFPRYETPVGKVIKRHLEGHVALCRQYSIDSSDPERDCRTVHRRDDADPLAFQCLMLADKAHAATEILILLDEGKNVVLDRWTDSALAYGGADGLDPEWLETIHAPLPRADVTVFLDVSPEKTRERGRALGDDRTQDDRYERDLPKLMTVYKNYRKIFGGPTRHHGERIVVDGRSSIDAISQLLWEMLGHHLR